MAHTAREKTKLLARVRRIRGQIEAIERALDTEKGCTEVLHHMHVANPAIETDAERTKGAEELIDVVRAYLK
jgi:DNA-binding FrmR family transcriptional regulator